MQNAIKHTNGFVANNPHDNAIATKMSFRTLFPLIIMAILGLAGCSNQEKDWELAQRDDNAEAYLEFLAKYPNGEFADLARQRMVQLKELKAWERAQFRDRENNYQRFLSEYPDSKFAAAARQRLYELRRDAAWDVASDSGYVEVLKSFLAVYPDAPQADDARKLIAALLPAPAEQPPPERPGNFRLQLGAFRTPAAAGREVRRLSARYQALLRGPIRILTPAETGGTRFLLRSAPMSGDEARSTCEKLKQDRQQCFVVNR